MSCISYPAKFIINVWLILFHKQRLHGSGCAVVGFVLQKIRVLIISLWKRKLEAKIEYFYLEDSEYMNEEFFIKIPVDLVTMAKSL